MDRVWKIPKNSLNEKQIRAAAADVASNFRGITLECDRETTDCMNILFSIQTDLENQGLSETVDLEISIYDLGRDGVVISLEPDAADNNHNWDEASHLAEELADNLRAEPIHV